ncbi:MAG TPA: GNAT family N-acetyltransferase [Patescibacteria group bacterium]|nr:GNAT family N-acetyltransferase [Patescibacteria group bacterium]
MIELHPADRISRENWLIFQSLQREAFEQTLPSRTQVELDHLVHLNEPDRFVRSHIDPNSEVGKNFNSNQNFYSPKVAVAFEGDIPVGFAYVTLNVSGQSKIIRLSKKYGTEHNYLWFREIAVRPEYQRQHVALKMARALLSGYDDERKLSAYVWPDEISFLAETLNELELSPTGENQVNIFGQDSDPIRQVRYQGLVGNTLQHIIDMR